MKFRRLSIEELSTLEAEFIQFLSANTVTGADWIKLKANDMDKADQLIDVFSDLVFEKIIKNIEYLEFKTFNDIKVFHCAEDKIYLNGLQHKNKSNIDLSDTGKMKAAINDSTIPLQLYSQEKTYSPNREQELFKMTQNGAVISDGELFKILDSSDQNKG